MSELSFSCPAGRLREALSLARKAMPGSDAQQQAYHGVLFRVIEGVLHLYGSDGNATIDARVAVSGASDGQVLLPPKPLGSYLALLSADAEVTVSAVNGAEVEVAVGASEPYRFRPMIANFALPPTAGGTSRPMRSERLSAALAAARPAVDLAEKRVQVVSREEGLRLHTTDGYRLVRVDVPEAGFGDFLGIVPLAVLEHVSRMGISEVYVAENGLKLHFVGPDATLITGLAAADFPAVDGVLDLAPEAMTSVAVADLRQALARLGAIAERSSLRCTLSDDQLRLRVNNVDLGSGQEVVTLGTSVDETLEFGMTLSFLLESVAAHTSTFVHLAITSPTAPLFLSSQSDDGGLRVVTAVMPVRLSGGA